MKVTFNEKSLAQRVVIRPLIEKVSKGGIIISQDDRKQAINTNQGEVVFIGPQAWYDLPEKPDIKPGDKVYYAKYGALVLKVDDELLVLCNDVDILISYQVDEDATMEAINE